MREVEFVDESDAGAISRLCGQALAAARWPAAAAHSIAKIVHGLSVARKSKRIPLPKALEAMEELLHAHGGAAAGVLISKPLALLEEEEEEEEEEGAAAASTPRKPAALTRVIGRFEGKGGDAALAQMQEHVNNAFLQLMTRLESEYAQ
jgi:hypothetical protein